MAIYHCSVKVIERSKGRSSVAAAAYRAAEKIKNEYDGVEHDFTKKNWVEYTKIMLPANAPPEYGKRSVLWNAVELVEKSADAQLAREFELALPVEFTRGQQIEILERFVKEKLISQGMVADIAIHNPPVTNDKHQPIDMEGKVTHDISKMQFINPHAHVLATMRSLDSNGKWERKSEIEYLCKKNGEERGFTADEYKTAKTEGWEKQYRYWEGKRKIYYTATEAKKKDLERVNRTPKTTPYGRKNSKIEFWNSKDRIFEWRQAWEKVINDEFKNVRSDIRVDSRSFVDRGIKDELPTVHMGTVATNIEKRAVRELGEGKTEAEIRYSEIGEINRQIKEHNKFVRELKAKISIVIEESYELVENIVKSLENIRAYLVGNKYEETVLSRKFKFMKEDFVLEKSRIEKYQNELKRIKNLNQKSANNIKRAQIQLEACNSYQLKRKQYLRRRISNEQKRIEDRNEYIESYFQMCDYKNKQEYELAESNLITKSDNCKKMESTINIIQNDSANLVALYKDEIKKLPSEVESDIYIKSRKEAEEIIRGQLKKKYENNFCEEIYSDAMQSVELLLKDQGDIIRHTDREREGHIFVQEKKSHRII